ncbi:DUF1553 domain-containing protein [Roseimicrobium sp. ORNL1]|uniref:DUF1553 domain-containing protein n=1 Tax=Roseimicrobium sp. ORNL1 TaxID=2711231 RepID=UPI0013E12CA0|nr:DUF1553 domain-containing protein [Roseimicrobium sp. ORNL1]QIF04738.1 DUF1553 domain-containing protein [Roseimicrobium sp. ORNL1]
MRLHTSIFQVALLGAALLHTSQASAAEVSFRNQVQPILARFGCSSGACHGAAAGQGGFRLSLRGYDNTGDFLSITRSAQGRRVTLEEPSRSLLLMKATKAVPHKGGEKIKVDWPEYQILAEWIANGAPGPQENDARIQRIEVSPAHVTLKAGAAQPIKVTAFFNNGKSEDVTRWAKYTAGNTSVATVDDDGKVKVVGRGEGTVTAWYLSQLAIATISVPYEQEVLTKAFETFKPRNVIDERVKEKLVELNIPPSERSTDSEFIRRAFLDTIGILPTSEETRAFLADEKADKRDRLIERLLQRPEFVDFWSYKWSDLLLVNSDKLPVQPMWSYYQWIRRNVELNTPWDVMVRDLLTSTGSTLENGAGNFFTLHDEPTRLAETVSTAFLGMSIACAKCHNHPMEKWTNDQYFAFANLFSRVRAKNGGVTDERVIFAATEGDIVQPLTGRAQTPTPLDAKPVSLTSTKDRRIPLADWLTAPENPWFARAITNRVWKNFFATALVESVDDLRMTNPASNEKLLSDAAGYLAKNKFDLKALMRLIMQSETYQRSSVALPENKDDTRFYSRYYPRRLMAEVMLDSVSQVTAVPTKFNMDKRNANKGIGAAYPMGYRAMQLPDSNTVSYFLNSFGRPDRVQTCDCERTNEPSMAQALHIANGDTLNQKLGEKENRVATLLASGKADNDIVNEAYLLCVSRPPTDKERASVLKVLADAKSPEDRRHALEDVFWGLMSSREFLFNH